LRKVVTILGARPQFIKASVVSHALAASDSLTEVLVHTGQHFDANMSEVFFSELGIEPPAYQLDIHGGLHGAMTARMLSEVERILLVEKPDAVLVYGDTNSTLAGALAAVKLHIPVAHVEAGLRSFNMAMPEEINRIVTDRISSWLFTPTDVAVQNLVQEGVSDDRIIQVGDVMFDAARHYGEQVDADGRILAQLGIKPGEYVLATIHRAENTDKPARLTAVVDGLERVARRLPVIWPMHPRTRAILEKSGRLGKIADGVHVIEPTAYLDMVQLEKFAAVIATDSGGVQKEAFFYQVPCVTVRDETEWVELVDAGWNRLAPPTDGAALAEAISAAAGSAGDPIRPYGDGDAADKVVEHLRKFIGQ
jgi:UDP-GlcNAc3NAcA epimerase